MAPRNREGSKTLPQRSNRVQSGAHHAPADRCRKAKVRTGARREGAACPIYHISGLVPSSDRYRNARGAMETPIGAFQHGIGLKRLAGCGGRPMHRNQHAARLPSPTPTASAAARNEYPWLTASRLNSSLNDRRLCFGSWDMMTSWRDFGKILRCPPV